MEFNVLPRAKILSPQSIHKSNQTTNQTVNVILPQQQQQQQQQQPQPQPEQPEQVEEPNPYKDLDPCTVHYEPRDVKLEEPVEKLSPQDSIATINFLKLVVEAYMHNPIKYNGYVICSVPVLENMIETLTSCEDCSIDIADIDAGCCGTTTAHIVPITKIWVRNGENNEIFKYRYSQFLQTFEQFNISLKFVYVD